MPDAQVRIFVSSPADVDHERVLLKDICERLRQEYLSYFDLQAVLWEEEALTADRNFQDGILRPADCDIVVVVLWTRLGTPLPQEPYGGMTGTQWEFVNAVDASARTGRPEVLVYKKTRPKLVDITNAEATREALEDRRRLEDFFRANFFNEDSSFRRAFRTFDSDAGFRSLVEGQLRKLLNRRISAEKRALSGPGDWRGSPFRPSAPYDLGDARIFTGRESEARDILGRLPGRRFLLVSGPSGCGKTSLIRAGVLPRLARPFLVEGVAGCRIALVDPRQRQPGTHPLAALVDGLYGRHALGPALEGFGLEPTGFAQLLGREPSVAAAQVVAALDLLTRDQQGRTGVAEGELRLALVLDPLDEVLAGPGTQGLVPTADGGAGPDPEAQVAAWVEAVTALATTGRVWVIGLIGTARLRHLQPLLPLLESPNPPSANQRADPAREGADQRPVALAAVPEAVPAPDQAPDQARKRDAGAAAAGPSDALAPGRLPQGLDPGAWYQLGPMPPTRVRQVVEIPARAAGIEVEGDAPAAGPSLLDRLEAEVEGLPHWPPLLEATLERLYEAGLRRARGGAPSLSAADHGASGGMAGVVLRRADALWAGLDDAARAALPRLCRALVGLEGDRPLPRAGDLGILEGDPGCRALVSALVGARLAVVDAQRDGIARTPCPSVDYSLAGYLHGVVRQTGAAWRARLGGGAGARPGEPRPLGSAPDAEVTGAGAPEGPAADGAAPGVALGVTPGVTPGETPGETQATQSPEPPVDWADWRPQVVLAHPVLLSRWAPVRDWLAQPANRQVVRLRHQLSRQARLWRRTDCNREHLLGAAGFAEARRLKLALAGEIEPLEAEYLAHSERYLRFEQRRLRAFKALGATLVGLLALATGAALWALNASERARVALHRSLLEAADTQIARGNTPQALMSALAAAPYLPQEATDTLSHVLVGNRLIAMVQGDPGTAAADGPTAVVPAFSDDGEILVTVDGASNADLWRLGPTRFDLERTLAGPGVKLRALAVAGIGGEALVLGGGPSGFWRLPAEPGAAPEFPCAVAQGSALAVDPTGHYVAVARDFPLETEADPLAGAPSDSPPAAPLGTTARQGAGRHGVCVFDLQRPGQVLIDRPLHRGEVLGLAFSTDGRRLATASADGSAKVIDLADGETRLTLPPDGNLRRPVQRAVFDPSGTGAIALACADNQVRVYGADGTLVASLQDIRNGETTVKVHTSAVRDVAYSPDGRYLVAGDDDGQVVRWEPAHPDTAQVLGEHDLSVEQVRVAPPHGDPGAEPLVLTASQDRTARLWGLYTGRAIAAFSQDAPVTEARFSTDGSRILTASGLDGSARLWGVHRMPRIGFRMAQPDHMGAVAFSPNAAASDAADAGTGLVFAVAGHAGDVGVWRFDPAAPGAAPGRLWLLNGHKGRVRRLDFAPSGRWLASAAADATARVWDLRNGVACVLDAGGEGRAREVNRVLFGPDEDWLLTTSDDRRQPVRLWGWDGVHCDPLDLDPAFGQGPARVQAAALARAPGGATLVATGDDTGRVRVVRREPGAAWQGLCDLQAAPAAVIDLRFSPDGTRLASAGEGGAALILVAPSGCSAPKQLVGHSGAVYSVRFAPDGASLVTAGLDNSARVWRSDGALLATLAGHRSRVGQAEFSPDGRWLLTGSRDGSLRLWSAPPGPQGARLRPFLTIAAGLRGVTSLAFSPDGNHMLAAYWGNAVQLWRLWSEEPSVPELVETWGEERARLAIIREADRLRRENHLDLRPKGPADQEGVGLP